MARLMLRLCSGRIVSQVELGGLETPDLLLANRRQHIHSSMYVQVSVPGRAYQFSGILAGCCTFLL